MYSSPPTTVASALTHHTLTLTHDLVQIVRWLVIARTCCFRYNCWRLLWCRESNCIPCADIAKVWQWLESFNTDRSWIKTDVVFVGATTGSNSNECSMERRRRTYLCIQSVTLSVSQSVSHSACDSLAEERRNEWVEHRLFDSSQSKSCLSLFVIGSPCWILAIMSRGIQTLWWWWWRWRGRWLKQNFVYLLRASMAGQSMSVGSLLVRQTGSGRVGL